MDLSHVRRKLYTYESTALFASDVRLVWCNCLAFNEPDSFLARRSAPRTPRRVFSSWS